MPCSSIKKNKKRRPRGIIEYQKKKSQKNALINKRSEEKSNVGTLGRRSFPLGPSVLVSPFQPT